jgi:hypothetical protein
MRYCKIIKRKIVYLYIILIMTGVVSCNINKDKFVFAEKEFSLDFQNEEIQITDENLSLITILPSPQDIYNTSDAISWKFQSTQTEALQLAEENGLMRSDIFSDGVNQLERKTWISDSHDFIAFRHVFTNISGENLKLNALYPFLLDEGHEQKLFGSNSVSRVLTQKTFKNGKPAVEFPVSEAHITSDPFVIINDSVENKNLFIGSLSFELHLFALNIDFKEADNVTQIQRIEGKSDFENILLSPNEKRASQWVVLSQGAKPYELITKYTSRVNKFYSKEKPVERPPSVYCTWYYHADKYNEEYFKSDIAAFKKDRIPFDVFLIDECWQLNIWGDFEPNHLFPSGMKWAAEQIRSLGYTAGIWTPPFLIDPGTNIEKNYPEWLLKNSKGELCTFFMNKADHYILDTTYPGVLDYLEKSYRKLSRDWGYEYYKFDFMRAIFVDSDQQFYDKQATSLEAYRKGLEAIRRGVGNDAYISVCGGHYGASYGIADSQRSGSDVKSYWDKNEIPKFRQNILRTWMSEFWHVDPDAMMVRRQEKALPTDERELTLGLFTDSEAQTNALNQYIGGGLVTSTEDFSIIDDDRKALYSHVIPSVNSSSEPLDIWDPLCPNLLLTQVTPVCQDLPAWQTLSVINWTDNPKNYEIILDESILKNFGDKQFLVSEFFFQDVLGIYKKGQTIHLENVEPHQSKILRITPWDGEEPVLALTDMHFSGGGLEINEWNVEHEKLTGTIDTIWNYPMKITIAIPLNNTDKFRLEYLQIIEGEKSFSLNHI